MSRTSSHPLEDRKRDSKLQENLIPKNTNLPNTRLGSLPEAKLTKSPNTGTLTLKDSGDVVRHST